MRGQIAQLCIVDEPEVVRDLLRARDLQSLPQLHGLDKIRGLQQRLLRAGVKPREAAPELLDPQFADLQIDAIQVGDLQLAARRRLKVLREIANALVVKIES